MKDSLATGLTTTARIQVNEARTIGFFGEEGRVYATPELVRDIEDTCRTLLLRHLDDGEDSVGTRIEVDHIAATLLGMWVDITVRLSERDGRRVSFDIVACDAVEEVAHGRHSRFIVDVGKTIARLRQKAEKAQG
jgi:fluoroacetyl-CoA thioesterase